MSKNILIYNSGGGLGDSIQLFPLILSLQNHFTDYDFYYLGAHENHFSNLLKEYNIKIKTLDLNLKYFGFRWWHLLFVKKNISKIGITEFDLVIDLQSKIRNTLILKRIPCINFYSPTYNFIFCSKKKNYLSRDNISETVIKNLERFFETEIAYLNYNLKNLDNIYIKEAKRLLPSEGYIGFSITQGNPYRKKSWPLDKFIKLANKVVEIKKTPVFFIEKDNQNMINQIKNNVNNVIFPELNSDLSCPALVTALSDRLDKAISIDNGIMHMIALSKTPMIVLFGPTNSKKFSPKKKNTTILDSKIIYKSNNINKIKIEDVFENI